MHPGFHDLPCLWADEVGGWCSLPLQEAGPGGQWDVP